MLNSQFSSAASGLVGQEMFRILEVAQELERNGNQVCHLELGDPELIPDKRPTDRVQRRLGEGKHHYCPSGGTIEFKESISSFIGRSQNIQVDPQHIVGAPANFLITNFKFICDPKIMAVVLTPCFPSYLASASMLGLGVKQIPLRFEKFRSYPSDIVLTNKLAQKR